MSENERIVCEFLRKIAPSREWEYLGEVEHYWIGELCDELNMQLKAENAELRELLSMYVSFARKASCGDTIQNFYPEGPGKRLNEAEMRERALELGVKGCK